MGLVRKIGAIGLAAAGITALAAAQQPAALAQARGGLWEISGVPGAQTPLRQCVQDVASLARIEHRGQSCTQVVISDQPTSTVIHYTCPKGGFGRTRITVITPRSLRIETQGISANLPFNYVAQARFRDNCSAH